MSDVPGYQDLSLIGRGATARVYRAVQVSTGQHVAIKILTAGPRAWDGERGDSRFARELRLCAQLHNPHIVRLMDQGVCGDSSPYAVFEYIPGHSLARHIAQHGPLSPAQTKELMLQALDALTCAHARGIIHRDLKPQNLMVTQTGPRMTLKVLDFGIGAWLDPVQADDPERLTLAHECLGTPAYCAPEQLKGEAPGPQSDLYAWGLIFLECLTGMPVLSGMSSAEIIHRQLSDEVIVLPPFIAQHPVARLLRAVLAKDQRRRTADAAALYERLAKLNLDDILPPARAAAGPAREQDTQIIPDPVVAQRAELRPLTLLCCKLKLVPIGDVRQSGPAALEQLLADKLTASKELLTRFGGYPAGALGGGLMAYFGYPYHSDQNARLAARTSLELRRAGQAWNRELASQGLRCVIHQAIHSGIAPLIQDRPLISELSNVALGMLFLAGSDQITISDASHRLLRGHAEFSPAPSPLRLDADEEIPLYLLLDAQVPDNASRQGTVLLGRHEELERLRQLWRDCSKESSAAAIVADAGMGKTELVKFFVEEIGATGGPALFWRCLPEYRHSALHPVLRGVEHALGLPGLESAEEQRSRLRQALADAGVEDANCFEVLCYWLNVPGADPEQRRHFSPERQRHLLYTALYPLILCQGREEPLLLVIDDIHWLDSVSLEFIKELPLRADGGRVLLLVTLRPHEQVNELLQWVAHRLPLPPLSESESLTFAHQVLGIRAGDPALVRKLVERSGGVPLFIAELAQMADTTRFDEELPLSLMDVLGSRIEGLGEAKVVLHWAAVAGHGVQAEWVSELAGEQPAWVQTQLRSLQEAGLLKLEQDSPECRYGFAHALYRDAAYQQINTPRLLGMHNRVADRLVRDEHLDSALIANHYAKGQNYGEAIRFALRAVRDDLGMASSEQALERISDLLSWSRKLPEAERHDAQLKAFELRGQALTHRFGWAHPTVLENVRKIQEFMQQKALLSTHKVKAATLWSLGTFYHVSSQRESVHQVAGELIDMADHLLDDGLAILGRCLHGQGHWIDGRYDQASVELLKARAQYDPQRHKILARDYTLDAYVWATATLALVRWFQGQPDEAREYAGQAIERARAVQHMPSLGIALMYQAYIHQYEQDRGRTGEVAAELLALAETYGLSAVQGYASALLGWASDDLERITGTLGLLKALGCLLGLTYLQSLAAEVSLRRGDVAKAQDLLNEGLQMAHDTGERYFLVPLYQQKAHALFHAGAATQGALQCLQRAVELSRTQGIRLDGYRPLVTDYVDDQRLASYWRQVYPSKSRSATDSD
ncbi:TOMM system kinase/cyclase fusion protein [Endothiovibrio diazotrophicus]